MVVMAPLFAFFSLRSAAPRRRPGPPRPRPAARVFLTLLPALLLWAPQPAAAQETITLEEAVTRALAANPGLRATLNEVEVAQWEVRSARGNLTLPSVGVNFRGLVAGIRESSASAG
jgi:outer membrane protein TolC